MPTIEILAKRAELFQLTGAELCTGGVRFHEGHLPPACRTPEEVRRAIRRRPDRGSKTVSGVEYQWAMGRA